MLLLLLSYIQDVARSVRRICDELFIKTEDSFFTQLLGISTLVVTMYALRKEGEHEVLHLQCAHQEGAFPKSRNVFFLTADLFLQDIWSNLWNEQ